VSARQVPVHAATLVAERDLARFRIALRELRSLGGALGWMTAQDPPRLVADIVTQDEYTHDVIVPWSERLVLVFDST
jgi:hypothetical protein